MRTALIFLALIVLISACVGEPAPETTTTIASDAELQASTTSTIFTEEKHTKIPAIPDSPSEPIYTLKKNETPFSARIVALIDAVTPNTTDAIPENVLYLERSSYDMESATIYFIIEIRIYKDSNFAKQMFDSPSCAEIDRNKTSVDIGSSAEAFEFEGGGQLHICFKNQDVFGAITERYSRETLNYKPFLEDLARKQNEKIDRIRQSS